MQYGNKDLLSTLRDGKFYNHFNLDIEAFEKVLTDSLEDKSSILQLAGGFYILFPKREVLNGLSSQLINLPQEPSRYVVGQLFKGSQPLLIETQMISGYNFVEAHMEVVKHILSKLDFLSKNGAALKTVAETFPICNAY